MSLPKKIRKILDSYKKTMYDLRYERKAIEKREHECLNEFMKKCEEAYPPSWKDTFNEVFKKDQWLEQKNEERLRMIKSTDLIDIE